MNQQIWNGILDAERLARYFQRLSDKLRWRHRILTVLLIVSASGAMTALLSQMPYGVSAIVMLIAAVLSTWLYFADYSGKAAAASLYSSQYFILATKWGQLWYGNPTQEEVNILQSQQDQIATGYDIPIDRALNEECTGEVYEVVAKKFAAT